jgi:hypothetical protein
MQTGMGRVSIPDNTNGGMESRPTNVSIPDISIDFAGDKSPAQNMQVG